MPIHTPMNRIHLLILAWLITLPTLAATKITYQRDDSLRVISLLNEGIRQPTGTNLMLYYGKKLQGIPYVAHTLEVNPTEMLVVNMRQMDCTTFVETVFALALTTRQRSCRWSDYCANLELIRYENGHNTGYASRNHYFCWWAWSNESNGLVTLPMNELAGNNAPTYKYARRQTLQLGYMSTHTSAYKMLKNDTAAQAAIAKKEKESNGRTMFYIPAAYTSLTKKQMKYVHDGDILALCTLTKRGLDTTHIGIASWGKDGQLHLLNASQIHKKVILEPMTLRNYMRKHPVQAGIWVIRPLL